MIKPRFHNWHYKHWLVHYISLREFKKAIASYMNGVVLDVGCGEKPYRDFITPYATNYIGFDYPGTIHDKRFIDFYSSAYPLPIANQTIDTILATAVLEHLKEPKTAIGEFNRVLKVGGRVICTAPFIWHVHEEPQDFYRYTRFGLEYLFTSNGFDIDNIQALSGFWVTFCQLLSYVILRFNKGPLRWFPILPAFAIGVQVLGLLLDAVDKSERWTWAYQVIARKR